MRRSIRWRIALPYVLLILLVLGGLSVYLSNSFRQIYLENLESEMAAQARLVADAAAPLMAQPGDSSALNALARRDAGLASARITLVRADGVVLGNSDADPAAMENHLSRPEVQKALAGQTAADIRHSSTLQTDLLYVAVPITSGGQALGVARVAISLAQVQAQQNNILETALLAAAAALVVAVALAVPIAGFTVRPLGQLTQAARQLAAGEASATSLPFSRDEIGELAQAFKDMATQLRSQIGALQAEQGKLAAVLAGMTDGVAIVDADGKIQLINPAAKRMFQVSESEALGHSVVEVLRHHQLVELWQRCSETSEQQSTTLELSVEHLFLQSIALPLGEAMQGSILLLFQDLTQIRRLETIRRDFVSNVSHELRTPLASLKALAETLNEGALEDPPAARRFLLRMDTEIDTLTQMVQELLELSRIESGRVPLKRRPRSPMELLQAPVERMRLQAERAGLNMSLECTEDLPAVSADAERITQVLVNLLHNAIKFTPPGGQITVSAKKQGEWVVFSVQDSGVGIPSQDLTRIFERFYKADRARSGGGTGLGLSIARHVVEAHGGRIWVDSIKGQGSTFYFTLPVQRPE